MRQTKKYKMNYLKSFGLIISVTSLLISCGNNTETETTKENNADSTTIEANVNTPESVEAATYSGRIAFINIDSLLLNYELYKSLEKKLKAKWDRSEREFNRKRNALEKDVMAFKQKEANNGFLSQESYMSQGQELMKQEQDLQEMNARLTQEIADEEARLNQQIKDSIDIFIEEYNKDANYDYILNKAFMIYGRKTFDITNIIKDMLNERYQSSVANKEEK